MLTGSILTPRLTTRISARSMAGVKAPAAGKPTASTTSPGAQVQEIRATGVISISGESSL